MYSDQITPHKHKLQQSMTTATSFINETNDAYQHKGTSSHQQPIINHQTHNNLTFNTITLCFIICNGMDVKCWIIVGK